MSTAFECVVNISEGRQIRWLEGVAASLPHCIDLHVDADHNRSVFTLLALNAGLIDEVVRLARVSIEHLDVNDHEGVHPRIGIVDVVPFVPLGNATLEEACVMRNEAATRLANELGLPCFLYGPLENGERSLPEVRTGAFSAVPPDRGPNHPHPTGGAVAVGARWPLVAWNIWLEGIDVDEARRVAASIRTREVRALGLRTGDHVQVSCNLIDPTHVTPADVLDRVLERVVNARFVRCELVGLAPQAVLDRIEPERFEELDLSVDKTIEARAASIGINL